MLQVYLCGNHAEAKQAVSEAATKLGFTVLDRGSLSAARELEDFPLQLFPEWRLPLRLAVGLTAFFFVYLLIRDIVSAYVDQGKDISFRIMVSLANKVKLCVKCVANDRFITFERSVGVFSRNSLASAWCMFSFQCCQVFPIVSLIMLSLCYLPGVITGFLQLYRGTKYKSEIKAPWSVFNMF